jgi:hypothetical protein
VRNDRSLWLSIAEMASFKASKNGIQDFYHEQS